MILRPYREEDAAALAILFFNTIRTINIRDYSQEQVEAWAPENRDMKKWAESFSNKYVVVAEDSKGLLGFGELEPNGHIDRFYVAARAVGTGVGRKIYAELQSHADQMIMKRLFVEASLTAKVFFEKMGFVVLKKQSVERRGVSLTNYVMEKLL